MTGKNIDFANERIPVLFRKLFYPTLFGMLSLSAVTTIDGIFIGHGVGSDGIAAVNICVPLLMIMTGIGLMVGAGCSVTTSISLAQGKVTEARTAVTQAMVSVAAVSALVIGMTMAFPRQTALLLGSSERLMPMVTDYLVWFSPSLLFQMWISVSLFAIRLDGKPDLAMWCSIIAAAVNVVLDWLLIFPLGWGIKGAAIATSLSCLTGAAIAVFYLMFRARTLRMKKLRTDRKGARVFFRSILMQCRIGSSALLGEMTMAILMFVGNNVFMHYLGDDGVGAFGVSCYYLPFIFMIGNAIAQSAQPIISYSFGLGRKDRIRSALRISLLTSVICGSVSTAAFILIPDALVGLFLPHGNAAGEIAAAGFPYFGTGFIFFILNLSVIGYYQSMEKIKSAAVFALLRCFVFLVPCFLFLPETLDAGAKGIWLALPLSEVMTCIAILLTSVFSRTGRCR